MKTLVVAEKPSVGHDIARVLKCGQKGDGYLYSDEYVVSWAIGHLVTLWEPEDYDPALKGWKKATLPIMPSEIKLKPVKKTQPQLTVLKKLMNSKEIGSLICATDSGREGELIFRYIYTWVNCKKKVRRLWISSMTDTAIIEGFQNMKDSAEYDQLYLSAKCRSEADWLVGINATRAYTVQYGVLLSVGRVQTPTLSILVERQKEIQAFTPKDYWEVKAFFEEYAGLWFDPSDHETKIFDREKADAIAKKVLNKSGTVESIEQEEKRQQPWPLYDLTELQRDANKRYGYSAQNTLTIAQTLYEKRKLITYPRTDSRYLSDDMTGKIKATLRMLNLEPYTAYAAYIAGLKSLPLSKRIIDNAKVTDHHAIIPTETRPNLQSLSEEERRIYDLIVRRFFAAFYPPHIYRITRVVTAVDGERFLTKGTTEVQTGFMELYKTDKPPEKTEDESHTPLPPLKKGQVVRVVDAASIQKKTKPPKPYTDASLLSAMENAGRFVDDEELKEKLKESGLGTPATRAAMIERLLQVGYVTRKGKTMIPTEKGMKLIEIVPKELKSPETTGKWEKGLTKIAKGGMDANRFMESIGRYVRFIVDSSGQAVSTVRFPQEEKPGKPKFTKRKKT